MDPLLHISPTEQAVNCITSYGRTSIAPAKVTQFTRPVSAQSDTQTPFTYTKAKFPQMNLTRKPAQNLAVEQNLHQPIVAEAIEAGDVPQEVEASHEISKDPAFDDSRCSGHKPQSLTEPIPDPEFTRSDVGEKSTTEVEILAPSGASLVPASSASCAFLSSEVVLPPCNSTIDERATLQNSHLPQQKSNKIPIKPLGSAESSGLPQLALSNEEQVSILHSRYHNERQRTNDLEASQAAKDIEIQDLKDVSYILYAELQAIQIREKAQKTELSKLHSAKLQWERRIQKVNDHVKDLTDDHQKLREDAMDIQKHQESISAEKASLDKTLKDVHHAIDQDRSRVKKVLVEARHEMELLEQTIEDQDRQLRGNADLLDTERDRSQRLEHAMSNITISYQELTRLFIGHKDILIEKVNDLLQKSDVQIAAAPKFQDGLKSTLDQCFGILEQLREAETLKPEDLSSLNVAVRSYAKNLTKSMQSTSKTMKEVQQHFSLELEQKLSKLSENSEVKDVLGEQLLDVREAKATIRERLQATEASLTEARHRAMILENREQMHVQRISELRIEVTALHSRGSESPQMNLRIQELECRNQNLQEQNIALQNEKLSISEQLEKNAGEVTGLRTCLAEAQSQLEEAHTQKIVYERRAILQSDKMREQQITAATMELSKMEDNHQKELQQLQQSHDKAENKVKEELQVLTTRAEQLKKQVERLQAEKAVSTQPFSPRNTGRDSMAPPKDGLISPTMRNLHSRGSQPGARQDSTTRQPVKSIMRSSRSLWSATGSVEKRTVPDADTDTVEPKRARKLVSQGLGPVIPDSQSPNGSRMAAARGGRRLSRQPTTGHDTKKDKYSRRFSQEFM